MWRIVYMKKETENLIYLLIDPRNDLVMYVGKSSVGIGRPIQHTHYSHSLEVREWVDDLKELGYSPTIKIIERNIELNNLPNREKYWIDYFHLINKSLLNKQLLNNNVLIQNFISFKDIELINDFLDNLGKNVKTIRYLFNLSQQQLANLLDINRSTLSIIENNKVFTTDILKRLIKLILSGELEKFKFDKHQKVRVYERTSASTTNK